MLRPVLLQVPEARVVHATCFELHHLIQEVLGTRTEVATAFRKNIGNLFRRKVAGILRRLAVHHKDERRHGTIICFHLEPAWDVRVWLDRELASEKLVKLRLKILVRQLKEDALTLPATVE